MTRRFLILALALLAVAATLPATTYNYPNPNSWAMGPTVGLASSFAINSLAVDVNAAPSSSNPWHVTLNVNYANGANPPGFGNWQFDPLTVLSPADFFFTINGTYAYGISTVTHSNAPTASSLYHTGGSAVTAGSLYAINSGGALTSDQVLGTSPDGYNHNKNVWMWNNGAGSITLVNVGTSQVSGGGSGNPYSVLLTFVPDQTLVNALATGKLGFVFENATCANWYVSGAVPANGVPEPESLLMCGAGLLALAGVLRRWRTRPQA